MTISVAKLDQLLEAAIGDPSQEPAFFRALLDAVVHAHCPAGDRSGRLQFVQFHGPDGELLLPFFSDRGKAAAAATPDVRIVSLTGRTFLESTLGACLVLNPNDRWCKLYPEEVRQLLASGRLAVLETTEPAGTQVACQVPTCIPDGLIERLTCIFTPLEELEEAYLVEMAPSAVPPGQFELVIALRAPATERDRIVRAVITDLQLHFPTPQIPLAVMAMDSAKSLPAWLKELKLPTLYKRKTDRNPR